MNLSISTTTTNAATNALPVPVPAQHLLLVPLSQLRQSPRNVRRSAKVGIRELAASIARVGLLQNLTVTQSSDGEQYYVVAGRRRLAALRVLAKQRRITMDADVPCLLVADVAARTASLTENLQREAMHPADQFEAFAALVAEGRTIEAIAADFAVTPLFVQRRLKLANISPRLMHDYREGSVTLEQLMALAITDEHAAQEAAFYDAPHWQREPHALRARLTEQEIDAYRHPLAQFVGLTAYEEAGGSARRDLFADAQSGVYLSDHALLYRLAQTKLDDLARAVRAEGWTWVDAVPSITSADLHLFERAPLSARAPRPGEIKRMDALHAKIQRIGAAIEEALDADDSERAETLHTHGEEAGESLQALERSLMEYSPAVRAMAGAIVTIDRNGEAIIHRGLMRDNEAKALRMLTKARTQPDDTTEEATSEPARPLRLSETLVRRLSAHRTAALQVELTRRPHVALAALVHHLLCNVLMDVDAGPLPFCIAAKRQGHLDMHAADLPEYPATSAMQELRDRLLRGLPHDADALLGHLLALGQDALLELLALCVALTLDAVSSRTSHDPAALLSIAAGLDMATWWAPTAEGYFRHIPKVAIAEAVREFAPQQAARFVKLTKADSASEAERLAAGTGWLPAMLRPAIGSPTAA